MGVHRLLRRRIKTLPYKELESACRCARHGLAQCREQPRAAWGDEPPIQAECPIMLLETSRVYFSCSLLTPCATGKGRHSAESGPVLREAVRRLLVNELHLLPAGRGPSRREDPSVWEALGAEQGAGPPPEAGRGQQDALEEARSGGAEGLRGSRRVPGRDARAQERGAAAAGGCAPGGAWRGGNMPGRIVVSRAELSYWLARRAAPEKRA